FNSPGVLLEQGRYFVFLPYKGIRKPEIFKLFFKGGVKKSGAVSVGEYFNGHSAGRPSFSPMYRDMHKSSRAHKEAFLFSAGFTLPLAFNYSVSAGCRPAGESWGL
ncbi:hypothetical protein, partial [Thermococcus sp.]